MQADLNSSCRHSKPRACSKHIKTRCRALCSSGQACIWRSLRKPMHRAGSSPAAVCPTIPSLFLAFRRLPDVMALATATDTGTAHGADKATTQATRVIHRRYRNQAGSWAAGRSRPLAAPQQPESQPAVDPTVLVTPASERPAVWWTRYMEQLHVAADLEAILTLAEQTWQVDTAQTSLAGQPAASTPTGRLQGQPPASGSQHPVEHWRDVPLQHRNEASAAVDTLEAVAACLKALAGAGAQPSEVGSSSGPGDATTTLLSLENNLLAAEESKSGVAAGGQADRDDTAQRVPGAQQVAHTLSRPTNSLSVQTLVRCQVVVWRCLSALQPLLLKSALRPKHLASLARAINALAAASPSTNTRQVHPAAAGFLIPTSPATQTDTSPAHPSTSSRNTSTTLHVLAKLPSGWSQAYASAVAAALPTCSPASLVYLLRALSLDRCKRILRAALLLSPRVSSRVAELAGEMSSTQVAVCLSCAAQMVWDPQGAWCKALLDRLDVCFHQQGGRISAGQAAAILHALACLRHRPPTTISIKLFTSMAAALPVGPPRATLTSQGASTVQAEVADEKLDALQLSSSVWAAARLQLTPPELWLRAHMIATFSLLQAGEFSGPQLTNMLWALGKLGWGPSPHWLAAFFKQLTAKLPGMRPGELGIAMWALSKLDFQPSKPLLAAVAQASAKHADHLDIRQLSMLYISWARLNYRPPAAVHQPILSRLQTLLPPPPPAAAVTSHTAPGTTQSPAVTGTPAKGRRWSSPVSSKTSGSNSKAAGPGSAESQTFSAQAVANIVWALHHLAFEGIPPQLVLSLAAECLHHIDEFNLVELGMVGRGLGALLKKAVQPQAPRWSVGDGPQQAATASQVSTQDVRVREQAVKKRRPAGPRDPELYHAYLAATQRQLQRLRRPAWQPSRQRAGDTSADTLDMSSNELPDVLKQAGAVPKGQLSERGLDLWASLPSQCAGVLVGAISLGGNQQPPEPWMDVFYRVTQGMLRVWGVAPMEVLMEALPKMQPPPTPPLTWVRAFIDRRDQLTTLSSTPKHLKDKMLLVQRIMKRAWQAKTGLAEPWMEAGGQRAQAERRPGDGSAASHPGASTGGDRPLAGSNARVVRKSNRSRRTASVAVSAAGDGRAAQVRDLQLGGASSRGEAGEN